MPFVDTVKLITTDPPPDGFKDLAEVTVHYKPRPTDLNYDPPAYDRKGFTCYYEDGGFRHRWAHGYYAIDFELPKVLGGKPCTFNESLISIAVLDFFGRSAAAFDVSRLDLCAEEPGDRNEISETLSDLFKNAPSVHRARYDNSTIYLGRSPKMVQRLRCYNRTIKTAGLETGPAGDDLLRFELQRRRPRVIRRQFKAGNICKIDPLRLNYVMAKNLLPLVGPRTLDYQRLIASGYEGLATAGFIVLREVAGEKAIKASLGKNTFYKLRRSAAGVKFKKAPPNYALRALRASIAIFRPDLAHDADAKQLAAVLEAIKNDLDTRTARNSKKPATGPG